MQTIEYRTNDKTGWGDGPWQDEPDKIQWLDEATGLPCLIVRNRVGALCGYVGVPRSHPAYGLDYGKVHDLFPDYDEDGALEVHGGLTFSNRCAHGPEEDSICHVVEPGEPDDVWWLGFDCAHGFDYCPAIWSGLREIEGPWQDEPVYNHEEALRSGEWAYHGLYKTAEYVKAEVEGLARQLTGLIS